MLDQREDRPEAPELHASLGELKRAAVDAAASLGWDVDLVPSSDATLHETVEAALRADAIVLLGGDDIAPQLYGGALDYHGSGHVEFRADAAHIAVIRVALATGKPLLGICRGLQLINIALGGTLIQHIEAPSMHRGQGSGMGTFKHADIALCGAEGVGDPGIAGGAAARLVSELHGDISPSATYCSHHQAIDRLGEQLLVAARASDGIIEAVVHESAPVTGVQWHPEHPEVARDQLVRLLRRLERQAGQAGATGSAVPVPELLRERAALV